MKGCNVVEEKRGGTKGWKKRNSLNSWRGGFFGIERIEDRVERGGSLRRWKVRKKGDRVEAMENKG